MSERTRDEIEADIARTRDELRTAVDDLSDRLNPRTQAEHALDEAKIALAEVKRKVTGEVRRPGEPEPTQTGWVVLGVGAAAAAALVAAIVRKL